MNTRISLKASLFSESVIREMTRLATRHGAINLAQGFPDFPAPQEIKDAASQAIQSDLNQYAVTWGASDFRQAIAKKTRRFLGIEVDPETEITVCCGSTEAMIASMMAVVDPGDEVVIFEPFYENYGPDAILTGAIPRYVQLRPPEWTFDPDELADAFGPKTRAIIINTPNNPTGKVFTRPELGTIAELCIEHDVIAITDEIYEHIVYDGAEHVSLCTLAGMRERTICINALSKSYSVTGWRVGYTIAPPDLTSAIRKVHDFLTVGAAAPLQAGGVAALNLPDRYYEEMQADYDLRREFFLAALREAGFRFHPPEGAYYVMADIADFGFEDDRKFARYLTEEIGVAVVPGSSFYRDPRSGARQVRFCFCKSRTTLEAAAERLRKLSSSPPGG